MKEEVFEQSITAICGVVTLVFKVIVVKPITDVVLLFSAPKVPTPLVSTDEGAVRISTGNGIAGETSPVLKAGFPPNCPYAAPLVIL